MCSWEISSAPPMRRSKSRTRRAPAEPIGTSREGNPRPIGAQESRMRCNGCWSWESHCVGPHHTARLEHQYCVSAGPDAGHAVNDTRYSRDARKCRARCRPDDSQAADVDDVIQRRVARKAAPTKPVSPCRRTRSGEKKTRAGRGRHARSERVLSARYANAGNRADRESTRVSYKQGVGIRQCKRWCVAA